MFGLFLSSIICEYLYVNIIVNMNSFIALNISVNFCQFLLPWSTTTLGLNEKLKLTELIMKVFWKSYWTMKYLALWFPGLQNIFWKSWKTLQTPRPPPPPYYILNVHSLIECLHFHKIYNNDYFNTTKNTIVNINIMSI